MDQRRSAKQLAFNILLVLMNLICCLLMRLKKEELNMKKIIWLGLVLTSLIWVAVACSSTSTSSSPVSSSPTATPVPSVVTGATIGVGVGDTYNTPNVTITHGQAVVWDSSLTPGGHTVFLDNYNGTSTTCGSSTNYTSFPVTVTFSTVGTYYFHCAFPGHSPCGSSTCGSCTGMAGSVVVN
jgi:hypothetical protein